MGNIRVYELAKKLKKDSKELIKELKKEGIEVKSHMSTLDKETSDLILEVLSETQKPKKKKKVTAEAKPAPKKASKKVSEPEKAAPVKKAPPQKAATLVKEEPVKEEKAPVAKEDTGIKKIKLNEAISVKE